MVYALLLLGSVAGTVRADGTTSSWAVIPSMDASRQYDWTRAAAERLRTELRSMGLQVKDLRESQSAFERRHSRFPAQLAATEVSAFEQCAHHAESHIAGASYKKTLAMAKKCLEPVIPKLEAFARDPVRAETIFNLCMFRTRAYIENRKSAEAKAAALECRRMLPDIQPSAVVHPPEVRKVMAEVDRVLKTQGGRLRVTSSARGCAVYVNGRRMGQVPLSRGGLAPGTYGVQVDCQSGELSRVYPVTVLSRRLKKLHIDVGFEEALLSQPGLGLMYLTQAEHNQERLPHALMLVHALEASDALLITPLEDGLLRIDRLDAQQRLVLASVRLRWNALEARFEGDVLGEAMEALMEARSLDLSGPRPVPIGAWSPTRPGAEPLRAPQASHMAEPAPHHAVRVGTGILALALYGLAWGSAIAYESSDRQVPSAVLYLSSGALSSGLLWTASWMLFPSGKGGITWWKWAGALVGVALTTLGALAPLSKAERRGAYDDMLLFTGAPLLLWPLQDFL
ncbi:MAG: PEGA domain-containing protein [Myxococcales bacterium]|nr:PEGA domain-containing protein [Myxococcales bacterium]